MTPSNNTSKLVSGNKGLTDKYELLGKIGEGTYGVVYLAKRKGIGSSSSSTPNSQTNKSHHRYFAIKTFKAIREGEGISPTAIREISLLRSMRHKNIVHLDGVHIDHSDGSLSLSFDYADHDLYEMIRYHRDRQNELYQKHQKHNYFVSQKHQIHDNYMNAYTVKSVMWQMLQGLAYMHQNMVIHRDLKPSNVLVMGEGSEHGTVKIADFGLARIVKGPARPLYENGVVVTIWYRAPELLLGAKHYTPAVDIWAAGCIFAELMMLCPLFQGQEAKGSANILQADQLDRIFRIMGHPASQAAQWPELESLQHWRENTNNIRYRRPEHPLKSNLENFLVNERICRPGSPAVSLLQQLLVFDPNKRITAEKALKHEYFKQEPLPGQDVFVNDGDILCQYPLRQKIGDHRNNYSQQQQQQQQSQQQNSRAASTRREPDGKFGVKNSSTSSNFKRKNDGGRQQSRKRANTQHHRR